MDIHERLTKSTNTSNKKNRKKDSNYVLTSVIPMKTDEIQIKNLRRLITNFNVRKGQRNERRIPFPDILAKSNLVFNVKYRFRLTNIVALFLNLRP